MSGIFASVNAIVYVFINKRINVTINKNTRRVIKLKCEVIQLVLCFYE